TPASSGPLCVKASAMRGAMPPGGSLPVGERKPVRPHMVFLEYVSSERLGAWKKKGQIGVDHAFDTEVLGAAAHLRTVLVTQGPVHRFSQAVRVADGNEPSPPPVGQDL